ncbi:DUF6114 domain-containing protein [Saccharothrix sp. HUAS TT1]|uniref:DUF6114 domain-containing protein n=1 Tax=unclassified Saccharothrix TaxID=2593673 RepID=UPI00345BD32B
MTGGFTRWRRSCPFAAGVLTTAAGVELVVVVGTAPGVLRFAGAGAPASWLLGGVLVVAGTTLLFDPARRHFAGVAALVAGLLSLVGANLGGFLLGFLLAVAGGALALAWVPDAARRAEPANRDVEFPTSAGSPE